MVKLNVTPGVNSSSPLFGLDARLKLTSLAVLSLAIMYVPMPVLGALAAAAVFLVVLSHLSAAQLWYFLRPFLVLCLAISGFALIGESFPGEQFKRALLYAGRYLLLLVINAIYCSTTPIMEMKAGFQWILSPFLRRRAARAAMMAGLVLRFIPVFLIIATDIKTAQSSRGLDRRNFLLRSYYLVKGLLLAALALAEDVAVAIEARSSF